MISIDLIQNLAKHIPQLSKSFIDFDPGWLVSGMPFLLWIGDRFRRENANSSMQYSSEADAKVQNQRLRDEVERLRSLLLMIANLNSTLNYERVLEMTLDLAHNALEDTGDSRLVSALMLFSKDDLFIASARGLPQADLRVTLPGSSGILGESLGNVQTHITHDIRNDPELRRFVSLHQCAVAITLPLVVGLEIYGLLLFGHPEGEYFSQDRVEILEAVAQQSMIAMQNAKLYRDLEQEKERIAEIQEEARHKLARDLHDGPTQSISAIAMRVNFARRLVQRDPNQAGEELFKIEELARRTTKEIRQMLFTLRPLILESEGLVAALRQLSEKMEENHEQKVVIETKDDVADDLEMGKQGVVFFIVEESVNNARKHAKASHIWVRLRRKGDLLYLEVEDDGAGFDVESVQSNYEQRGSLGMVNLHERTELVNGIIKIVSKPGRGTKICVTIPVTMEAAEDLHRHGFAG
ncbi:MAG: GAF domain-containing sensor histidine kinase [Anaerolineales bacterium]|nr:GAF domain-containing sensor histidine kinase [Anaerolineales bacterium]TFH37959.1 MAG: GAF domain-containing sensor histidine kinase [Anaerolineales bacterium]